MTHDEKQMRVAKQQARTARMKELRAELNALIEEEADEVVTDKAALKDECRALLKEGKKHAAVKLFRERSGLSLRESMDVVEQLG